MSTESPSTPSSKQQEFKRIPTTSQQPALSEYDRRSPAITTTHKRIMPRANNAKNIKIQELVAAHSNQRETTLEVDAGGMSAMSDFNEPERLILTNQKLPPMGQQTDPQALRRIEQRHNTANNFYRSHRHLLLAQPGHHMSGNQTVYSNLGIQQQRPRADSMHNRGVEDALEQTRMEQIKLARQQTSSQPRPPALFSGSKSQVARQLSDMPIRGLQPHVSSPVVN